jgi:hypothetical protein
MEIFEQYFYDESIQDKGEKNSTTFSNIDDNVDEKISIFKKNIKVAVTPLGVGTFPGEKVYRLGCVYFINTHVEIEQVSEEEIMYLMQSPLAAPTSANPCFVRSGYDNIQIYPNQAQGASVSNVIGASVIVKPANAIWGYTVVRGKALYNPTTSRNFMLHPSDETELVFKILSLAGIVIAKPGLGTYGDQQITTQKTQEKQ